MYNFRRRKSKTTNSSSSSSRISSSSSSSFTSNNSSSNSSSNYPNNSMCRSSPTTPHPDARKRRHSSSSSKRSRSSSSSPLFGILRRPSWGGLVGLGSFRRHHLQDPELRKSVLPRRPACMDLNRNVPHNNNNNTNDGRRQGQWQLPMAVVQHHQDTKNDPWETTTTRPKKLSLLEELQKEPLKTKEEIMTDSQKWKALDDLVEMAYKIRVSDDYYDWDKLLEEDVEDEEDVDNGNCDNCDNDTGDCERTKAANHKPPGSTLKPQHHQRLQIAKPQRRKAYEKPSIHLARRSREPVMGPGVLLA